MSGDNETNIDLKKFNIEKMDIDSKVVIIGKPRTGKSTLITDVLWHHRNIPLGTIISGTEEGNHYYSEMLPDLFIHGEYKQSIVDDILARQKAVIKRGIKNPNAFLVLDDCMDDSKWLKHKTTKDIFKNGRHWKIFVLISSQYSMDIPSNLRTCIDYVFILKENIINNRKRLFDNYCGMFPTFDMFNQVLNQCTENFECLVVDQRSRSNRIDEVVFWYKADLHPKFRIGSPLIWKYHDENYNNNHDEEDDVLGEKGNGIDNYRKKVANRRPVLNVTKSGYK